MSGINPDQTLLSLKNVSVIRRGERILDKVSLTVQGGEIVTLIGPNGSGKSTLVKTALGLIKPDSGQIIRSPLYSMAYVPQSIDIDETLPITVQRFFRLHSRAARTTYVAALEQTGAAHLIDTSMHHLSGGEMRRVLLARAIVRKPALLILDEPTAGVDIGGQAALYALIQDLRDKLQCGVLLVSHDLHIVMAATDRVVCLNRHLCCSGTPQSVSRSPEFAHLFGDSLARELAVYHHHHDHEHGLHGEIYSDETHTPHG
jgi:zinc transport system ATP-binding protein